MKRHDIKEVVKELITVGGNIASLKYPASEVLAGMINEVMSNYNAIKFDHLLRGLSSGLDMESQVNELYNFVSSSPEKAMTVADLFRKTINAQSLKVCVIYGLILKDHVDEKTNLTQEELIVCKALENATDYDLKNFKKMIEGCIENTQETGKHRVLIDDLPDKDGLTITCDWCVYNRLFVNQTGEIDGENDEATLDLRNRYYTTNPANVLKKYIDEASSIWEYGEA